jgi:hypothetical protein
MPTVHNQSAHISFWPQGLHIQMVNHGTELTHDRIMYRRLQCAKYVNSYIYCL